MASHSYLTITGKKMGLISDGCSTKASIGNKCQAGHTDQILVLALNHAMTSISNVSSAVHSPLVIHKHLDKSSPLLAQAMADREELSCEIDLYRTVNGGSRSTTRSSSWGYGSLGLASIYPTCCYSTTQRQPNR